MAGHRRVHFRVHSYTADGNPFTLVGVWLFGQWQRRQYLISACRRIRELTIEALPGEHPAGAEARAG